MPIDSGDDITAVVRMVKDYRRFVNQPFSSSSLGSRFSLNSSSTAGNVTGDITNVSLNQSASKSYYNTSMDTSSSKKRNFVDDYTEGSIVRKVDSPKGR